MKAVFISAWRADLKLIFHFDTLNFISHNILPICKLINNTTAALRAATIYLSRYIYSTTVSFWNDISTKNCSANTAGINILVMTQFLSRSVAALYWVFW
jgi:hypothetical protein